MVRRCCDRILADSRRLLSYSACVREWIDPASLPGNSPRRRRCHIPDSTERLSLSSQLFLLSSAGWWIQHMYSEWPERL